MISELYNRTIERLQALLPFPAMTRFASQYINVGFTGIIFFNGKKKKKESTSPVHECSPGFSPRV